MDPEKRYKLVVFAPEGYADKIREAMGNAGAGKIGNYSHCFFTTKGIGTFKPLDGANPVIGEIGKIEEVKEDRIETVCEPGRLNDVIKAIKKVHPYEEPAIDVYLIDVFE
jgi:hypothetical protein